MLRRFIVKYGSTMMALALMMGSISTAYTCRFWFDQPKEPEGLADLVNRKR